MMKHRMYSMVLLCLSLLAFASCSQQKKNEANHTGTADSTVAKDDILTGEMAIIVDEAVYPLIQEQIQVFKDSYVSANLKVKALPEREAINALLKGEGAMAILNRTLTKEESAGFDQRKITPRVFPIFYDGVVFVNNIAEADTSVTVNTLSSLLKGELKDKTLVFDNVNSSTFRQVKEWAKVEKVSGAAVKGMKNTQEVFKYLLENKNAIGAISYGQYIDYRRKFGEENKIRILSLQNMETAEKSGYFKPSQSTFATGEYPLKTEFYVLNYQPNMGLGIGFSAFLTGDRGQRIVLKYGLLPTTMPGREIIIRDNIN